MDDLQTHIESHRSQRAGWLRAAVLGANDGLISTGSLVLGMASAGAAPATILQDAMDHSHYRFQAVHS